MTASAVRQVLVVGMGTTFRGDDGIGLDIARDLAPRPGLEILRHRGEALDLLNLWVRTDTVILVDALQSEDTPGTLVRIELADGPLPLNGAVASTHLFGLRETLELARTLDRLPSRVVFLGVTGSRFGMGDARSPEIEEAIPRLHRMVNKEINRVLGA